MPIRRRDPGARIVKRGWSVELVINDRHILKPETQHAHKMHRSAGVAFCLESEPGVCIWTAGIHLLEAISGFEPNPAGSKKSKITKLSPAIRNRSITARTLKVFLSETLTRLLILIYIKLVPLGFK